MSGINEAVATYLKYGLRPIRVQTGGKKATSKAWQNSEPKPHEFLSVENIGIDIGRSADLVDIDLDVPAARALAAHPYFFAEAPSFGREGEMPGHRLVNCQDREKRIAFDFARPDEQQALKAAGIVKTVMLELRAGTAYTVFPPSIYFRDDNTKQRLVWTDGEFSEARPNVTWAELRFKAGVLALVSLVAEAYPAKGSRDVMCMHLAGALVRAGVEPETADGLVVAVAKYANDEEAEKRAGKTLLASEKIAQGEEVTGLPALLQQLGLEACERRIRAWLGGDTKAPQKDRERVTDEGAIDVGNPEVHVTVKQVERLVREKSGRVYRRGTELVRVRKLDEDERVDGIVRRAGLSELAIADPEWLTLEASRCGGVFVQMGPTGYRRVPPPRSIACKLAAVADETDFPLIRGISLTPTLGRSEPGYDALSKTLLVFPPDMFPEVPMKPTREDAEAALERLERPLREFPFVDYAARSVILSAMLSAVVRNELSTCPMHAIDAPTAGSGKSKLADIVGIMSTGVPASAVTFSSDQDENEKRLATILRCGDPVILLDNVTADLEGDFLCQMLTQENVQARILGLSERVRLSTRALVLANGNNLRFRGDISRRVVVCRIDARMTNPEERDFDFDPVKEVRDARVDLVAAALTVLRAYQAAAEKPKLPTFGSYEDWELIRGALVWLDRPDPIETKARAAAENPIVEERGEILAVILHSVGLNTHFTLAEMESKYPAAAVALGRLTDRGQFNKKSVGHLLRKHKDVPFLGVTLHSKGNSRGAQTYWVAGEPDEALRSVDRDELLEEIPF